MFNILYYLPAWRFRFKTQADPSKAWHQVCYCSCPWRCFDKFHKSDVWQDLTELLCKFWHSMSNSMRRRIVTIMFSMLINSQGPGNGPPPPASPGPPDGSYFSVQTLCSDFLQAMFHFVFKISYQAPPWVWGVNNLQHNKSNSISTTCYIDPTHSFTTSDPTEICDNVRTHWVCWDISALSCQRQQLQLSKTFTTSDPIKMWQC